MQGTHIGLSPLARGTRRRRAAPGGGERFIPAGAGNTLLSHFLLACDTVYPRWRGEHGRVYLLMLSRCGLSPLARGTLIPDLDIPGIDRFIPAGAGNTAAFLNALVGTTVYPRWRGEHRRQRENGVTDLGLSPLARGTLPPDPRPRSAFRFIPAGAGNTWPPSGPRSELSVYPRWRGEHVFSHRRPSAQLGLSPLARGTQVIHVEAYSSNRFIPAGAGNTPCPSRVQHGKAVYPRWRGEHPGHVLME